MNAHVAQHTEQRTARKIRMTCGMVAAMAVVLAAADMADAQRCLQRVVVDDYITQLSPSIDLRQEWAVVGAPQDDTGETNAGATFVLRRNDNGTPTDQEGDL